MSLLAIGHPVAPYPKPPALPPRALAAETKLNLPEMVAAHAAMAPNAAAVVTDDQVLTYGVLDLRANQLANRLIDLGVNAETIVAICLPRSVNSVMSALAVLKAGGAYLPLDPNQPTERLRTLLEDAKPRVVITTKDLSPGLSRDASNVINIDDFAFEENLANAPANKIADEQLAYVIYTSGSTGTPKGVEVMHANLMNLVTWHQREFSVTAADCASHLASVGFDAAVWEVWPYLTAGATLYLPNEDVRRSHKLLRDWLVANEITISFLPTALAERVMVLDWPKETALRLLLTGADTLHRYPGKELPFAVVNNYGPTEATVVATSGR